MQQLWLSSELRAFLKDYRAGEPIEALAVKYGRSPDALRQQASRAHVYRTGETLSRIRNKARLGGGESHDTN